MKQAWIALACLLALVASAAPLRAQLLRGRVLDGGKGVASVPVTLHRVTAAEAGEVARSRTDRQGRFSFSLPEARGAGFNVFFVAAEFGGVRYFGRPLHPTDPRADYTVAVYDTVAVPADSSPVQLARRDVVLLPDADGGWEISEILQIRNPEQHTLVAPAGGATWRMSLPVDATDFEVAETSGRPQSVSRIGSGVFLRSPLVPGVEELFLRYRLPPSTGAVRIRAEQPTDALNLLVRQPAPELEVSGLAAQPAVEMDGQTFIRYSGERLRPGFIASVRTRRLPAPPVSPALAGGAAAGLVLAAGAWAALRRAKPPAGTTSPAG